MNCDGVRGLLSAYLDGELSAGELLRVEQHLRRCHWCADEVDALRQTIAHVASLAEVEVPPAFHAQLHQRLVALGPPAQMGRVGTHRVKRPDFRRWAVPAAAAAALVIGVTGLNRFMPQTQVPQPPSQQVSVDLPVGNEPSQHTTPGEEVPTAPSEQVSGGANQPDPTTPPVVQEPSDGPQPPAVNPGDEPNPTPTLPEGPVNPGNSTPLGPTGQGGGIKTASTFLDDVPEPTALPSQLQYKASFEVTVANPKAMSETLVAEFGDENVNDNENVGIIQLQISVPSDSFEGALTWVENHVGVEGTTDEVELNSQLDEAYRRIASLESEREALEARLESETDASLREAGQLALENLKEQAAQQQDAYHKLLDQVENSVITVVLKPERAQ